MKKPEVLYKRVVEVDERVQILKTKPEEHDSDARYQQTKTGEWIKILQAPDPTVIRTQLQVCWVSSKQTS
jgi:hypothetical protein